MNKPSRMPGGGGIFRQQSKPPISIPLRLRVSPSSCRGFALVIVMGILMLLIVLAVGFISSAGNERAAASGFRASVSTRQLADTAVSLVQGQINMAATRGATVAWASQPGMARTFNNTDGSLLNAYKLYSAPDMISDAVSLTADVPPEAWTTDTAHWTDLNAPVEGSGGKNYPILDPSSLALPPAQQPEGFSITAAPGANAYQQAPMPVRWLYMLREGQVVAPSDTSGTTATIPGVTAANPIVGRVAFWTDDETCKVNINTASAGTYWDVPRARTNQELAFAQSPPWQKEFQRYPGHPATTSLQAVLPSLSSDQIYSLIPRVVGGGSEGGTIPATASSAMLEPENYPNPPDRLYASVDELVFKPDRTANGAGLDRAQLEQARFFLTAHSRAPETNLWNLPRIACWPVFKNLVSARTTAFDRLIAFCASTGPSTNLLPYYFQREKADSPTNDIAIPRNLVLYSYLRYLTDQDVPGFGGNFKLKYGPNGEDRDQILTEVFDYIRSTNLHDESLAVGNQFTPAEPTPGHGFVAPTRYTPPGGSTTMGFGRALTLSEAGIGLICNATADDPATTAIDESFGSNLASGTGSNAVLGGTALAAGEKYIQAIFVPEFFCPMAGYTSLHPNMRIEVDGLNLLTVTKGTTTANLFPDVADGSSATYTDNPAFYWAGVSFGGNPSWRYFGDAKVSPARSPLAADTLAAGTTAYPFIGRPIKISAKATGYDMMTFSGGTITVRIYSSAVGGDLLQTMEIYFPNSSTFPIPNLVNAAVGASAKENWWAFSRTGAVSGAPGRLNFIQGDPGTIFGGAKPGAFFLRSTATGPVDVVRTVMPRHGDYRLIAASQDVPDTVFGKQHLSNYDNRYVGMAASLGNAQNTQLDQGYDRGGKYIGTVPYPALFSPDIPSDATQTPESTGDFDNCLPTALDGPFINKPDEGSNPTTGSPYFNDQYSPPGPSFFSPNRQMPSPGMLGSLPTGVKAGIPWRTLLFRPQTTHPSHSTTIPDHLLLDLFWMPVVEPYAISDRFSTAGKINMNFQILPFTYIERSTGLRALLKAEKVAAVPNNVFATDPNVYKYPGMTSSSEFRLAIDSPETLSQFTNKFSAGNIFKSASEICDLHIVPAGQSVAGMATFWNTTLSTGHALTAENLRERIYTTLYPRLTTKSNTFTVHFRVQALKQVPSTTIGTWTEDKDVVLGEYRGSTSIERFIDANNPDIPDYAATPTATPVLDTFYRWRILSNRQFAN